MLHQLTNATMVTVSNNHSHYGSRTKVTLVPGFDPRLGVSRETIVTMVPARSVPLVQLVLGVSRLDLHTIVTMVLVPLVSYISSR